jgi:para-aminobenzoate synthetase component 1
MLKKQKWFNPLDFAYQVSISNYQENWIFLYSGLSAIIKNSKSYICLYPQEEIIANNFDGLETKIQNQQNKYFGYFSYDLKNELENLPKDSESFIEMPKLWMIKFGLVLEFNHDKQYIWQHGEDCQNYIGHILGILNSDKYKASIFREEENKIQNLNSNFSKKQYLSKVKTIRKHIENGDIYQANLTRKFFGEFATKPQNPFTIFLKLSHTSPANYSSFLRLGKNHIISSSPELFLKISQNGQTVSSPIKGTAKRFLDKKRDNIAKQNLQTSPKEQAENLMIVDLVRNDLAKHCLIGSIFVKNLFKIFSYKTLHHLSSDIYGTKSPNFSNLDVVKGCFPAGSMTGAPKINAMKICSVLEKQKRGVYSGAIGFIDSKNCQLSVVIRTLILEDKKFELQVGGAITFDSNPQQEWQETINKSKGIAQTLGIKLSDIRKI